MKSDEECNMAENIAWMNQCKAKDDPEVFTQCIAFDSKLSLAEDGFRGLESK